MTRRPRRNHTPAFNREMLLRLSICLTFVVYAAKPFLQTQKPDEAFVAAIKAASMGAPTLGVIGSDIAAAHPLARMIGARFLSVNNSDWLGALAFVLGQEEAEKGDASNAVHYQKQADAYLDTKYAEFVSFDYDLIVVQRAESWTDHVLGQARFAALLSAYHPIAKDERFTVYGRSVP